MAKRKTKFAQCVEQVSKRKGVRSPSGVCATAGRSKYGRARFQRMAAAGRKAARLAKSGGGRRRANPVEEAAETYRQFHGHEPAEIFEFKTPMHEHGVLSGIGKLVRLVIKPEAEVPGVKAVVLENFGDALLAQNEKAKTRPQLYIVGGDQSVDLRQFGITRPHESEVLGRLDDVVYHTVKTHLRPEDGGRADYDHKFARKAAVVNGVDRHVKIKGSRKPVVLYDVMNRLISITGGTYDLAEVGIRG